MEFESKISAPGPNVKLRFLVEARLHYAFSCSLRNKSLIGVSSLPLYLLESIYTLNTRPGEVDGQGLL